MSERRSPNTLEEAYRLRDEAENLEDRDFYQEQVYRLRRTEYRSQGIRTEVSSGRRERQRDIEFCRETFFLEVGEIAGRQSFGGGERLREEARRHAARLDTQASLKQLASPRSRNVELYRRNFLELLRIGKSASEAYYISRVIGPVDDEEFRSTLEDIRQTGYPRGKPAYAVERAAIRICDLPGGMILILSTFFASLCAFVWALQNFWGNASAGIVVFVALGLIAAGGLMLASAVFIVAAVRSINKEQEGRW